MSRGNFEVLSGIALKSRRTFNLANEDLLSPLYSNPLEEGEWLELNSNGALARGTGTTGGNVLAFPVVTERGSYDAQALRKTTVMYDGDYEAETKIVNTTGLGVGDALMIGDVTIGGLTKRGLLKATGAPGEVVVGHVTKTYSGETKVRFLHQNTFKT